jgi:CBS domain-containing protein
MIHPMREAHLTLLTRLPGCARLEPEALAALEAAARVEEFPPRTRLVGEGEPAPDWYCIIESGGVQVSRVHLEAAEILDSLTAGDVFDPGTPGLPAACSASTLEPTRCVLVPQSVVARHRGALGTSPATVYRSDLALFVRRVGDLVKGPPVSCRPEASVAEAARLMTGRGVGSVIVVAGGGAPLGIVTDRDLRIKVVAQGLASGTPVSAIMSSPLLSVDPARPAFDALLEMTRRGIHHMGVVSGGRLEGVVSSHDIMMLQGTHPVGLVRDIEGQGTLDGLAEAAPRVQGVVKWLAEAGAGAFDIGRIVAELNDRLVRRVLELVQAGIEAQGHGRAPLPFAWFAAGSEGRREQTLKTDQDNGLVYADPPPSLRAAAADYFARLAGSMGEALIRLGFPPCPGGFMASNPRWCQPESVWRRYFTGWMETQEPEQVLHASLFFDLRPVAGDEAPGRTLWEWVCERAPAHRLFLGYMAKAALERHVPLGFFGGFVVERAGTHKDMLDLKARAVFPVTQAMRVCALSLGLRETNTLDRLLASGREGLFSSREVDDLRDAHEVIARLRLTHQLARLDVGAPPDNFINPETLGKADRLLLKEAFKTIAWLQRWTEDRFQTDLIG